MVEDPAEPTAAQCSAKASLGNGYYALWYPQMGGYVGKAVVHAASDDGCVEVWIWHDGEFPFSDGDEDGWTGEARKPARLHHCDVEQFRQFADDVRTIQTRGPSPQR